MIVGELMKIEDLKEINGILMDEYFTIGLIKDKDTDDAKNIIKNSGFNKEPIKTFKSLPILKLKRHKIKEHMNRGDCIIGEAVYDASLLAQILSLIGKRNVELYQEQKDFPLGIKVKDKMVCLAPIILYDESDKDVVPTLEEII